MQLFGDRRVSSANTRRSFRSHCARGRPKPAFPLRIISAGSSSWKACLRMYFCSVRLILSPEGTRAQNSTSL